jgi:mono/diheme cytochrome c family protein
MMRIQSKSIPGTIVALLTAALVLQAAVHEGARMERQQRRHLASAIEVGADLYESNCRTCHGSRGEGVGQLGPALADKKFFTERIDETGWQGTLEAYIIASSSHGRLMATRPMYAGNETTAVMAPWLDRYGGPLREDQIRAIAVFVMNWESTALGRVELIELEVPKTNLSDPRTLSRGKEVFLAHCAQCHLIANVSQPQQKGPELTHIGTAALSRKPNLPAEDYLRESFLIPNAFVVEGFEADKIGYHCGGLLSSKQLDEVVAFLLAQR